MGTGPYKSFSLEYEEGWAVFLTDYEDGPLLRIQRIDDPEMTGLFPAGTEPLFASDDDALTFVRRRAAIPS